MARDRRKSAATAATGAALLAGGGKMRHVAVERSVPTVGGKKVYPRVHVSAVARRGDRRAKALYAGGSALGLFGAAPFGVGVHGLVRKEPTAKRDKSFLREGLEGTTEALGQQVHNARQPVPKKVRAAQVGTALGAGAAGATAAGRYLRLFPGGKPLVTPIAGALAATATVPATNKVVRNRTGYELTPTGAKRVKSSPKRPSSKASTARPAPRSFTADVSKIALRRMFHGTDATTGLKVRAGARLKPNRGRWQPGDSDFAQGADPRGPGVYLTPKKAIADVYSDPNWHGRRGEALIEAHVVPGPGRRPGGRRLGVSSLHGERFDPDEIITQRVTKRESYAQQRATITAAAGLPVVGPLAAAAASRRYAAPQDKNKATARQLAVPAFGLAAGAGGAYGGAALAGRSPGFARQAERGLGGLSRLEGRARGAVGLKPGTSTVNRTMGRLNGSKLKATSALTKSPARVAGATAGFLGVKALANFGGGQGAITLNQRDQRRAALSKADAPVLTQRQKHKESKQKMRNAALSTIAGVGGLASGALLLGRKNDLAFKVGVGSGSIGSANSLYGAHLQRRDAKRADPLSKRDVIGAVEGETTEEFARRLREIGLRTRPMPKQTARPLHRNPTLKRLMQQDAEARERYFATKRGKAWLRRNGLGRAGTLSWGPTDGKTNTAWRARQGFGLQRSKPSTGYRGSGRPYGVHKADADHKDLLRRYGDRGPLPKGLPREEKIKAYEARYAAHGGHKGERWQRRANAAEGVRNAGLAGATMAGTAYLAAKTPLGRRMPVLHNKKLRNRADTAAIASGTLGGGAELYGEYARNRRASYASAPGGVAASALTRLRANTPKETR